MEQDEQILQFEAMFEDGIGNNFKGIASLTFKQIREQLEALGYIINQVETNDETSRNDSSGN